MTARITGPFIVAVASLVFVAGASAQSIDVWKSASCGCCALWVKHLEQHGYTPKPRDVAAGQLARIKADARLPADVQSCHTAKVGGYVIEGHVPAEDIKRLLLEKPDAIGLAVPGMPAGSPGMEAGGQKEPYEVLLVRRDGATEVFSRY
jgi:hypothetical protein